MADAKISQLTSATVPLEGTEVAPIVQSGATKKVAVSEFVNSKNTFTRLQTSNGTSAAPVTQDGFIFQATASAGRAGFKFVNRQANNGSQAMEAWTSDTSNVYAMRWRIDEVGSYVWGPGTRFTYDYGNLVNAQTNHYKIAAGSNGLGFATSSNTQWLNFFNLNSLSSPNNIARIEVTATSTNNATEAGYMAIYTRSGASSTAPLETIRFGADGDVTAARGNLVIGTAGKGIDFSADGQAAGMTSELLDDYEEGTWTPTLVMTGTNFTSVTYNATTGGRYTKIGNRVFVSGSIRTSALTVGSPTGVLAVGNLPFTVVASSSGTLDGSSTGAISYAIGFTGNTPGWMEVSANSTVLPLLYRTAVNGAADYCVQTDPSSDITIRFSAQYATA
jgi:hypothetical protein